MSRRKSALTRRSFLAGLGGVAVGLPFLEGVQDRSAWAADDVPVFGFFLVAANGVVPKSFWPTTRSLTAESFAGLTTAALGAFADDLLIVENCKYPGGTSAACRHSVAMSMSLTGLESAGNGQTATASGISADMVISNALNGGKEPLTLYSGAKLYIAERISFAGAGPARAAQLNPYATYQSLMGVTPSAPSSAAPSGSTAAASSTTGVPGSVTDQLLLRRKSVNDVVRDELATLKAHPRMSADDKRRLDLHLESVLQLETNMNDAGVEMMQGNALGCVDGNLNKAGILAFKDGIRFSQQGNMIEDLVKLHFETVALAFACNANRVATLQWGDGTDGTLYAGITGPGWPFHHISHRTNSDGATGNNMEAEQAHVEIDAIRMRTLAYGLQQFKDRGLFDNSFVYWTNHVASGPEHSFFNLPVIIAGNAGGKLKQAQLVDSEDATNDKVLATLINTTGASAEGFGLGKGDTLTAIEV